MKKILALVMSAVLVLSACCEKKEVSENANGKPVVKIGVLYPMSGDSAVYGEAAKIAADMFFEEFNKKPHKFDYQLIFEDTQFKLVRTAALAQKLINVDKVDVLITIMSNIGSVVSPLAETHKVLHFCGATDPEVAKGKYNFLASSNVKGESKLFYDKLVKLGAKKLDVVIANAVGHQTSLKYFQDEIAKKKELQINNIYTVNPDERDFRLMLRKIEQNKPDYLVVMLPTRTADIFMRQYHELGIKLNVTAIETFTMMVNRSLAEGMWYIDTPTATEEFTKRYTEKTGQPASDYYAEYMDFILQMITMGYEGTQSEDKLKVADYIENNMGGVKTAVGVVSVEPDGIINGEARLKKIVNGKPVIIEE